MDLVEVGKNGYLLEVGDREQLEACLEKLLDEPELIARMGEHSRWVIDNRYNINTYMENVVAAVEYAAERR